MPLQVLSRQAVLVRAQFEANRSVSNLAEAETLVAAGEMCTRLQWGVSLRALREGTWVSKRDLVNV